MKKDGLTLLQMRAAELMAKGKGCSDKEVIEKLGISKGTLDSWKQDEKFKVRVLQLFEDSAIYERASRAAIIREYLKPIYNRIGRKLKDVNELRALSLRELVRIMTQLHTELRADKLVVRPRFVEEKQPLPRLGGNGDFDEDGLDSVGNPLTMAGELYTQRRKATDSGSDIKH